jgi:hypothetical protein
VCLFLLSLNRGREYGALRRAELTGDIRETESQVLARGACFQGVCGLLRTSLSPKSAAKPFC